MIEPERVRFNRPTIVGSEMEYVRQAVEGGHTACSGPFSTRAADLLREEIGAAEVLLTSSCTNALELAALLLGLGPDDTVIVPSFTFVTTASAFARTGVRILFADIESTTLGIDPAHVAELLDDSVRAVVPVHYAGIGCDLEGLVSAIGDPTRVDIVEDNAHGVFGSYRGRPLGSFGRFATLSFHETKNFICGEGGALIVNRDGDVDAAHLLYDKGTDRRAYFAGRVDKYSWREVGGSFGLSDILAAYLLGQLEMRDTVLARRRQVFERYDQLLGPSLSAAGCRGPAIPDDRQQSYHMYYVLLPDASMRDRVLDRMQAELIFPTFHYVPLHTSKAGRAVSRRTTSCPVTDDISGRLLRLPFHNELSFDDQERVTASFLGALSAG